MSWAADFEMVDDLSNYHLYAEDTQLYVVFKNDDIDSTTDRIADCVSDICLWMERNELKLNK